MDENKRLRDLYKKVKELTDQSHRTVEQSMHLLGIDEKDKEKILNDIADDKDRYRWKLKEFLVSPSYANLKKLDYFCFNYDIVIYDENRETVDIDGEPIDPAEGEPTEEEIEMYEKYRYIIDESVFFSDEQEDYVLEPSEKEQIWAHWEYLERCLDKFIVETSEDSFVQYLEARKWVKERESLRQSMEAISKSPALAQKQDFVTKVKKRIEQMDLEILSK